MNFNIILKLKYYIQRFKVLSSREIIKRLADKINQKADSLYRRQKDLLLPTYKKLNSSRSIKLYSYISTLPKDCLDMHHVLIMQLSHKYINHIFDILGSGWIKVKHGMSCKGFEGFKYKMEIATIPDKECRWIEGRINDSNLDESQSIWRIIDTDYTPIDWQLDFKSGYRWSEKNWYRDIPYNPKQGVDIKVPWELARMQHLIQLAWAYALAIIGRSGFEQPNVYVNEFRNQILDFISSNPPRFGVNWNCTMDVSIRIVNWLIAYDLFKSFGACFDIEFENVFFNSIYDHGCHTINNLEWHRELHANHYLSNIVGLLFVSAYLPCTPETDVWLSFAVQELIKEVEYQFNFDGSNFEASTSYHCLSAELVIYATALVLGLPDEKQMALHRYDHNLHRVKPKLTTAPLPFYQLPSSGRLTPFPLWYIERLAKMAEFIVHIIKPDGRIPQFGDNDNGRFLKLLPVVFKTTHAEAKSNDLNLFKYFKNQDVGMYLFEDYMDRRNVVATFNGLFKNNVWSHYAGSKTIETYLVKSLAGNFYFSEFYKNKTPSNFDEIDNEKKVVCYSYPDFGLSIFKTKSIYLAIRCGSVGQHGIGGHCHNDQLSFEFAADNVSFIADPGTYVYTASPKIRNQFRSTDMHNTLSVDGCEQNSWEEGEAGLFRIENLAKVKVIQIDNDKFVGELKTSDYIHRRSIKIKEKQIHCIDEYKAKKRGIISFHLFPEVKAVLKDNCREINLYRDDKRIRINTESGSWSIQESFFSSGYGIIQHSTKILLHSHSNRIEWGIKIIIE